MHRHHVVAALLAGLLTLLPMTALSAEQGCGRLICTGDSSIGLTVWIIVAVVAVLAAVAVLVFGRRKGKPGGKGRHGGN